MKISRQTLFVLLLISFAAFPQWQIKSLSADKNIQWNNTAVNNPSLSGSGSIGIRAGVGTDINLGIAYGGGINYLLDLNASAVELGFVVFGGSFEETTNDFNTYNEKTDILVFGVLANYLFGYQLKKSSIFGVIGLGFAAISVDWEESSPDDVSLGTPLPGGGSKQSENATAGGSVINLGFGMSFNGGLDLRAEAPTIFIFGAPGDAAAIVPTFLITVGYRF